MGSDGAHHEAPKQTKRRPPVMVDRRGWADKESARLKGYDRAYPWNLHAPVREVHGE